MTLSGKTVLIDTLLSEYPTLFGPAVRVITIEDTRELLGAVDNIVMKEASPQRSVQDLIRNTLRQSPDILVLGEARGKEMDALLSMWLSGHGGSVCSLHAGSPREAMLKMEMAVEEGKPKADPRRIAAVVHLVVVTERRASDKWGVKEMTRVVGWKEGEYLFASAEEGGGTMSSNP
jgi:Flp pilus assembly CpaF family ATPase